MKDDTDKEARILAEDAWALKQLCSTAHLACSPLSDEACRRLAKMGLALPESEGFWRATAAGTAMFLRWTHERAKAR